MQKGAKLGKKVVKLGNKKVRNWAINLPPKKGEKLGKKGAKLDNGPEFRGKYVPPRSNYY